MRILVVSALASLPFLGSAMAKTTRGAFGDGVTWNKDNVQAIPGQNVVAGDFNALVVALESETAYANVHTVPPAGATPPTRPIRRAKSVGRCFPLKRTTSRANRTSRSCYSGGVAAFLYGVSFASPKVSPISVRSRCSM